jgi:hypothetical protein
MPIDYNKYPPNWKSEIVPTVLIRASNCCEECGLQNHSYVWAITLTVREYGRYKQRSVWFRNEQDATREAIIKSRVKKVKVVLTISHTDHDEENHDVQLDRLRALCQLCHLRYDAKEKYRRIMSK